MDRMGYDYEGCHGEGRIMVFVGDLIDRGPDSISVVRLVRRLVEAKRAYCILGNHELNVLLGKANSGSKWLYGEKESLIRDKKDRHTLQALADEATRCEILDFLQNLPIVLERSDVRVVHAAWDDAAVDKLRSSKLRTVLDAYYFYKSEVDNMITSLLKTSTARAERDRLLAKWTPTGAEGLGPNQRYGPVSEDELYIQCGELMHQNENPVNVVLTGFEKVSPRPFFAGGKGANGEQNVPSLPARYSAVPESAGPSHVSRWILGCSYDGRGGGMTTHRTPRWSSSGTTGERLVAWSATARMSICLAYMNPEKFLANRFLYSTHPRNTSVLLV
mmetsp:Transcript_39634/g.157590  ORF Transcript_39634/g.157590 Transcript_39634/m.157590 type:complete len:332 (+) Transcript_39634:326-1321(+)